MCRTEVPRFGAYVHAAASVEAGGMRGCASRTTDRDAGYVQKMRAKITFPADSIREWLSR
jgi:hypothetical protein